MPSLAGSPSKTSRVVRFEGEKEGVMKRKMKEQDGNEDAPTSSTGVSKTAEKIQESMTRKMKKEKDGDFKPPASAMSPNKTATEEEGKSRRRKEQQEDISPTRTVRAAALEGSIKRMLVETDSEDEVLPSSSTNMKPAATHSVEEKKKGKNKVANEALPTSSTTPRVSREAEKDKEGSVRKKKREELEKRSASRSPKRIRRVVSRDRMANEKAKEDGNLDMRRSQSGEGRNNRRKEANGKEGDQATLAVVREPLSKRESKKPKKYEDADEEIASSSVAEEKQKRANSRREKVEEGKEAPSTSKRAVKRNDEEEMKKKKETKKSDDKTPSTSAQYAKRKVMDVNLEEEAPSSPSEVKQKRKYTKRVMKADGEQNAQSPSSELKPKRKYERKLKVGDEEEAAQSSSEVRTKRKYVRKIKIEDVEESKAAASTEKAPRRKLAKKNQKVGKPDDEGRSGENKEGAAPAPSDEYYREKMFGVHYPGKVYVMTKQPNKKDEIAKQSRVQRILEAAGEDEDVWDDRALEMHNNDQEFEMDFVAGCTDPNDKWDSPTLSCQLLIVYKGFPRGEWLDYSWTNSVLTPEILEFVNTQRAFDKVEDELREECTRRGLKYEKLYKARYLPKPARDAVYGTADIEILRTLQMARQNDINDVCKKDGVPPLFIADWSGTLHDFESSSINTFKFSNYPVLSKRIQRAFNAGCIERMDEHCTHGCSCFNAGGRECTCKSKRSNKDVRFECSAYCKCDINCSSRIVQRGRQVPLIIMRHHIKGYTIRLFSDINHGDFVHEYVGGLVTYQENKTMDQTYALDQSDSLFNQNKKANRQDKHRHRRNNKGKDEKGYCHRALVVNGLQLANEARFNSHGCRPKLKTVVAYVDRESYGLHRTAFFADRDMKCGEELTWNYHGKALTEALNEGRSFETALLPDCDCGEPDCPIRKQNKKKPKKSKDDKDDKDPYENDYDSFPDTDEEEAAKEEERRKKDRGHRLQMRRASDNSSSNSENVTPPR